LEGLADEIALLRMRLKKAMVEEGEELEVLSLAMERLSRAIGVQHKMSPKKAERRAVGQFRGGAEGDE